MAEHVRSRAWSKRMIFASLALAIGAVSGCSAAEGVPDHSVGPLPTSSETVPAPSGGDAAQTEPAPTPVATTAARVGESASVGDGVTVSIDDIAPVDVVAQTPGEMSGPALAVTVRIANDGSTSLDATSTMVSLTAAQGVLGQPSTAAPYSPIVGPTDPGSTSTGVFVFMIPESERADLEVTVQYAASAGIAVFASE